jgi:hypothetical protein
LPVDGKAEIGRRNRGSHGGTGITGIRQDVLDTLGTCYWCGASASVDACPDRDEHATGLHGAQVSWWTQGKPVAGVVADVTVDRKLVAVDATATPHVLEVSALPRPPVTVPAGWTAAGRIAIGATWFGESAVQRAKLDEYVLDEWTATALRHRKLIADDLLRAGRGDLLERFEAPEEALDWLRVLKLSSSGQHTAAFELALRLPAGLYPGRLAVIAAATEQLAPAELQRAIPVLKSFQGVSAPQDRAVGELMAILSDAAALPSEAQSSDEVESVEERGPSADELRARAAGPDARAVAAMADLFDLEGDAHAGELQTLVRQGGLPSESLLSDRALGRYLLSRHEHLALTVDADTDELGPTQRRFVTTLLLHRSRAALLGWQSAEAAELATRCLGLQPEDDAVRAEALTLLAAARASAGNRSVAANAAEAALRSHRTIGTLVNAALTADQAGEVARVGRWANLATARQAPLTLRAEALGTALDAWYATSEADDEPPRLLVVAARRLVQLGIADEPLQRFLAFLSTHDASWLADPESLHSAVHRTSPAAEVFVARAQGGLFQQLDAMAIPLRSSSAPGWLQQLRDQLVTAAIEGLFENDPAPGFVYTAHHMLDIGLPVAETDRFLLRALVARGTALLLDDGDEPAERYLSWLEEDTDRLPSADIDSRQADLVRAAQGAAFNALTGSFLVTRLGQLQSVAELHDQLLAVLELPAIHQLDSRKLEESQELILRFCGQTTELMYRLLPHLVDAARDHVHDLIDRCTALAASTASLI